MLNYKSALKSYYAICIVLLLASWWAFGLAAIEPSLIYQPLKSYLLPIQLEENSSLLNASSCLWTHPQVLIAKHYRIINEIFNVILASGLSLVFFSIYFSSELKQNTLSSIQKHSLILAALFSLAIPSDSSDMFGYIARGAQQVYFNLNPFTHVVSEISHWREQDLLANLMWQNNPSPYGPLFMLLSAFLTLVSFKNFYLALLIFKLFNFVLFYLLLKLFTKFTNNIRVYALLSLNPFFLVEILWNGHNDILMAFLLLYLLHLLIHQSRYNSAVFICFLGLLIKYLTIVLLPLILIYAWKQARNCPYWGLASGLGLTGLLIGFYDLFNSQHQAISENATLSHKSLFDAINSLYKYFSHQDLPSFCKMIFFCAFVIFALWIYYKFWRYSDSNKLLQYSFYLLAVLICLVSPKFHSWYLINFLPLGLLVEPWLMGLLTGFHLFSITLVDQANIVNFVLLTLVPWIIYKKQKS